MLKIGVFLVLAVHALGAVLPVEQQPPLNGRIVGGAIADIISFPWMVSLQKEGEHSCGAVIHSNTTIITAAHCLYTATLDILSIRAGSSTWNNGGVLSKIAAFKIHEDYERKTTANDIAVMRLETPLTFSSTIRPISLATQEPVYGAPAVISGWGTTWFGSSTIEAVLRYANVNIVDTKQCASNAFSYGKRIQPNMICAAAPGKDSCQSDSGGPMVSGGVLVGIVSFGTGCADVDPGVYANVAILKEWIENAAKTV